MKKPAEDPFQMRHIDSTGMTDQEYRVALAKERKRVKKAEYLAKLKSDPEKHQKIIEYRQAWRKKVKEDPEKYQKYLESQRNAYQRRKITE